MKTKISKFFTVNFGIMIMALGLYFFLIPVDLAVGGVTGIAMVVNKFFPSITIGSVMLFLNIILFILAFFIIGKEFGGYTIYTSFALSGAIYLLEVVYPLSSALAKDIWLNLIIGIIVQGLGMAIIFYNNASTGGTDIIAKIINKFTKLEIGKSLFIADFIVIILACFAFSLELGLYALLGILMNSLVIDKVIDSFNTNLSIMIVSDKHDVVNNYIVNTLNRGATMYNGSCCHSEKDRTVITTVMGKNEYSKLKKEIKIIDPGAFISTSVSHEVLGNGFTCI